MRNVVDLALCADAQNSLRRVIAERGLSFFVKPTVGRSPRIDSRRIAWVVEAARRRSRVRARHTDPDALARTRRVVRREIIRRLAEQMVQAGL